MKDLLQVENFDVHNATAGVDFLQSLLSTMSLAREPMSKYCENTESVFSRTEYLHMKAMNLSTFPEEEMKNFGISVFMIGKIAGSRLTFARREAGTWRTVKREK